MRILLILLLAITAHADLPPAFKLIGDELALNLNTTAVEVAMESKSEARLRKVSADADMRLKDLYMNEKKNTFQALLSVGKGSVPMQINGQYRLPKNAAKSTNMVVVREPLPANKVKPTVKKSVKVAPKQIKPASQQAATTTEIPVLASRLPAGHVLTADDFTTKELPKSRLRNGQFVTDIESVIGLELRRAMAPNRPLRVKDAISPQIVKKRDVVRIQLVMKNMVLAMPGIAMENGAKGDTIRVMNDVSKKVVTGKILESGVIAIKAPMPLRFAEVQ